MVVKREHIYTTSINTHTHSPPTPTPTHSLLHHSTELVLHTGLDAGVEGRALGSEEGVE